MSAEGDAFAGAVGMPGVVAGLRAAAANPVHAYLLVGDAGAGMRAASAFAAALLCRDDGCGHCRECRLTLAGQHPDALTYIPEGAFLQRKDGEEIIRLAMRSPVEGQRKVLVLAEMHRVQTVGPMLLKTIEEPPASTVFVVLADHVPPELVTIASRCVRIDLPPLAAETLAEILVGDGADVDVARSAADAAAGSLDRGRLLVADPDFASRRDEWARVPERLDGRGAVVVVVVDELRSLVERAAGPLTSRQAEELASLEERVAQYGERGAGRKALEEAHKRQHRRHRAEELRFGLATLARRYRDALESGSAPAPAVVDGLAAIDRAALALGRNPNESLLLQDLLLKLPPLR